MGVFTPDYSNPISTTIFIHWQGNSSAMLPNQCLMTDSVLLIYPSNQVFKEDLPG